MQIDGSDITMVRGDSEVISVSLVDSTGSAVPLVEGDTVYFTLKKSPSDTTKLLQKVVTEFTEGKATITILPADTKALEFRAYSYDVQINFSDGSVKTVIGPSQFKVSEEVTYE
jgi:hypothetical protein